MRAPLPPDEAERLETLRSLDILDTEAEPVFDELVELAAGLLGVPISLVSLVDRDRQWFKARFGVDATETPRDIAFCAHGILQHEVFEVSDALLDDRFATNPLVTADPKIRFYAGMPLRTGDGKNVGMLCVIDHAPRKLTREQRAILATLGRAVAAQLDLRRALADAAKLAAARDESERAVRVSEKRLRQTLAAARAGVWEWDFRQGRGFWSDEDYRLIGYEPGSVEPGLDALLARIHEDDREQAREAVARALETKTPFEHEYRVVRPDGTTRWLRDAGSVECDADGTPVRLSGIVIDVTERKASERLLFEQRNELSAANAELERAARLKDEFLAAMSHELRTPLNAVLGLAEGLGAGVFGDLSADQAQQVTVIEDSGRHLLHLINDILDLSKIGAGKLELFPSCVEPSAICNASVRMVRESALRKRINVSTRHDPALGVVRADPLRLRQILVNLLSNAVKFTQPGGAVSIETRAEPETGRACFTVADNGIGIAAEDLSRLFMPFVQLDSSLAREHSGTGLGLSLVQRLAELHGGGIFVESAPGNGSRFTVALPWEPSKEGDEAVDGHAPATREPARDAPVRRRLATGGEPPLLLVVDDHEANVLLLSSYLSGAGYRVAVARNGLEAIERTSTERPALILMDIQMPGIDGLETTRRIRNLPAVAATPIVAVTALAMPDDREKALAAGVDDYVTKPLQLSKLVQLVESHLERASRPGA